MTADTAAPARIRFETASQVALEDVTVLTPNTQRTLVEHLSVHLPPQACLIVVGPSGVGRVPSCGRSLACGSRGQGSSAGQRSTRCSFSPTSLHDPGALRAQLLYPATPEAVSEATLRRMLAQVHLG